MREKHRSQALGHFLVLFVCCTAPCIHALIDSTISNKGSSETVSDDRAGEIDSVSTWNKASFFRRSTMSDVTSMASSEAEINEKGSNTMERNSDDCAKLSLFLAVHDAVHSNHKNVDCEDLKQNVDLYHVRSGSGGGSWCMTEKTIELLKENGFGKCMHLVTDCLEDNDFLLFNTTQQLSPALLMSITKDVTIATYRGDSPADITKEDLLQPMETAATGGKAMFKCKSGGKLFAVKDASVTFANIVIEGCLSTGESTFSASDCTADKSCEVSFINVEFENNTYEGCRAITAKQTVEDGSEKSPINFSLQNVIFKNNRCYIEKDALIDISGSGSGSGSTEVNMKGINASDNSCTVVKLTDVKELSLADSEFSLNKATTSQDKDQGAAIQMISSHAIVKNVSFFHNRAKQGGAVHLSTKSSFTGEKITFDSNSAENDGGAVYVASSSHLITKDSDWSNNSAENDGGAVYLTSSSELTSTDSVYSTNRAKRDGGAVFVTSSSKLTLTNSNWSTNSAERDGGAVYAASESHLISTDSDWKNNSAENDGGAIYLTSSSHLISTDSDWKNNSAENDGGAVYVASSSKLTLTDSNWSNNSAENDGGAVYLTSSSELTSTDSVYSTNRAKRDGGAVFVTSSSKLTLTNSNYIDNLASENGGAFYLNSGTAKLVYSNWNGNSAKLNGGAFYVASDTAELTHSECSDNHADGDGGAFYIKSGTVTMENSTMSSNRANGACGAFCVASGGVTLTNLKWHDNSAGGDGGAFCLKSGNVVMEEATMSSNSANGHGGALFVASGNAKLEKSIVLKNNRAEVDGGAIYLTSGEANLEDVRSEANEARNTGGVMYATNSSLDMSNCKFKDNSATEKGGGLFVDFKQVENHFQLSDSTLTGNKAKIGGAIYQTQVENEWVSCSNSDPSESCPTLTLSRVVFKKNEAKDYGAIAFLSDPSSALYSCDVESSSSELKSVEDAAKSKTTEDGFCENWDDNIVTDKDPETEEFSSLFHSVRFVAVNHSDMTEKTAENDDSDLLNLGPLRSGSRIPAIHMKQLDVFGNELQPSLNLKIDANLVFHGGYFEGNRSDIKAHMVDNVVSFPPVMIYAPPGEYTLSVSYNTGSFSKTKHLKLTIDECAPDEVFVKESSTCAKCDSAHYKSGGECVLCPAGSECHGLFLAPTVGKWHKTPCQSRSRDCLTEDACKYTGRGEKLKEFLDGLSSCEVETNAVDTYDTLQCDEGYKGPLCGSCAKEYGSWTKWMCFECRNEAVQVLLFIAALVWMGLVAYVQIWRHSPTRLYGASVDEASKQASTSGRHSSRVDIQEPKAETTSPLLENFPGEVVGHCVDELENKEHALAELIKIWMNYLQLSAVLVSLHVKWVPTVRTIFELATTLGGVTLLVTNFTVDCVITRSGSSARPLVRLIAGAVTPFIVGGCLIAVRAVMNKFTCRCFRSLFHFILLTFSVVFYVSYLGITKLAVRAFYCINVYDSLDPSSDKQSLVLADDTAVECYEGVHWAMVFIAAFILLCVTIGFPLLSFIYIYRAANNASGLGQNSTALQIFGFMFWSFESRFFYWELIVFARKAFLGALCVFSHSLGGNVQQVIAAVALTLFLSAQAMCSPYRQTYVNLNFFETSSLILSSLNVLLAMVLGDEHPVDNARVLCTVGIICVHAIYSCIILVRGFKLWFNIRCHTV